jgi:proteasome lid subunit RPN8/RPN11
MEEAELYHEEYPEPKPRKIYMVVMGIFLSVIILVYFLTGSVFGIISGLIESSNLDKNKVEMFSGVNLVFLDSSYSELLEVYNSNLNVEFKACLQGYVDGNYYVENVIVPEMIVQEYDHVSSKGCPDETIVDLHSHPDNHCLFSEQDYNNFEKFKKTDYVVMGLMCKKEKFNFYQ